MKFVKKIIIILNIITHITSDINYKNPSNEHQVLRPNLNYAGEKFPVQYLFLDDDMPTILDLNRFMQYLRRSLEFFGQSLNGTDCNTAFASFVTKALLKRTLRDYRSKLQTSHLRSLSELMNMAENILSHYIYRNKKYGWTDPDYKLSKILQNDDTQVHNIENFNRNRLRPWVLSNAYMNNFMEQIDEGTLPKEKFVELVTFMSDYYISLEDSDECITRMAYSREPLNISTTQACLPDAYCVRRISSEPSTAYALSHRMLNLYIRLKIRNCYIKSVEDDLKHIEKLCAFMYREAVYIARRGFFARDLFLEHITLCSLMGYEEFHRMRWFNKAISWVTEHGCVKEFGNFEFNRSLLMRSQFDRDLSGETKYLSYRCEMLNSICDDHPTALLISVLGHAIRYSAHYMLPS